MITNYMSLKYTHEERRNAAAPNQIKWNKTLQY